MLIHQYKTVRQLSEEICLPLQTEDYVVQPVVDVSPPKWHLGHSTWFFETFVLKPYFPNYQEFNPQYNFVFNSYYETLGARVIRTDRGNLSRPTVSEVYQYRKHVDEAMYELLQQNFTDEAQELLILGLNHEQQHQELLWYDIKYILGHNPLFPAYADEHIENGLFTVSKQTDWHYFPEGLYQIGYQEDGFCFDNELAPHQVYLQPFYLAADLVSNQEYLNFIDAGGYQDFRFWHQEGWDWVHKNQIKAPLYWHNINNQWQTYTLSGLKNIHPEYPVMHISYYEAAAYAAWKGCRLATEFEWEAASSNLNWGQLWEWTESAYLPYPGFSKAPGAIGEYNGKFMVNQKVLRGASIATAAGHQRKSYRNFFHPHLRWHYNGIRLAK
ncbi:ergothioneine biosynthesis protein EgtB [Pedobacter puniceum]|uniref:Ergothioneine biosynthesis protein EgtB n=1 Tax=Pedobacter puniceum TaxID=2666136 RepID=A0A7K0FNG0_9SPHI|nr:ergothioneine biosynthesis protein EgtB [Pedobacter puniceum]MRX47518.1 ergothioneine biosynthesis protein EgtB [Pedobacter puniceum]